jgi:hypothetical protein
MMRFRLSQRPRIGLLATVLGLSATVMAPAHAATAPANPNTAAARVSTVSCANGVKSLLVTPAPGFDPLTATNPQLLANFLPTRPDAANSAALAVWRKFVTSYQPKPDCTPARATGRTGMQGPHTGLKPAKQAAVSPNVGGSYEQDSANWAGNIATGTYWNYASATFTIQVPQAPSNSCAYSSQWVGIGQGGSSTYPLVQAGSEDDACFNRANSQIYLWWEETWQNVGSQQAVTPAHAGDVIFVFINVPNNCGTPIMTVDDETSGFAGNFAGGSRACSDGTAEWIYERTEEGGTFPQLANAAVTFTDASLTGPGVNDGALGNYPHYWSNMWNCRADSDTELAAPGPIDASGRDFTDNWKAYGTARSASQCSVW